MSTFLSSLLDRSRNIADVLRPRPVSRFEPATTVGYAAVGESLLPAADMGESSPYEVTTPTVPPVPRPAPSRQAPASDEPSLDAAPRRAMRRERPAGDVLHPMPPPASTSLNRPHPSGGTSDPEQTPAAPPPPATQPRVQPTDVEDPRPIDTVVPARPADTEQRVRETRIVEEQRIVLEPVVQRTVIEERSSMRAELPPSQSSRREAHAASREDVPSRTANRAAATIAPTESRRVVAYPRIQPAPPAVAAPLERSSREPHSEPAPTINVTIGRIEVRATSAASSPKAERRGPAVMSLDEYLRARRNGGER